MAASLEHTQSRVQKSGVLPPWLWFWLVLYIQGFSSIFDRVKLNFLILFTGKDGIHPVTYDAFSRVPGVVEILLDLTLFVGVLTVFLPWVRTTYLQRRFGLIEPQFLSPETLSETLLALSALGEFAKKHAPELILMYNNSGKVLRDRAFIYPIGYRRTGLAVSGNLLAQWNKNPQAAEAVLLHEIEHYRHGDTFMVGAGSLLETIIKRWFSLTAVFVVVPIVLSLLIEHITSFRDEMAIAAIPPATNALPSIILSHLQQVLVLDIPAILLILLSVSFWAASLFTLVVVAIWSTEINADRFVVDTTQSTQMVTQTLPHGASSSWWRWLLTGIHHPPVPLRRWLVLQSENTRGLVFLLLFFPSAWFLRLVFLSGWALSQSLMFLYSGTSITYVLGELGINIESSLETIVPVWIVMAVLMVLWPFLSRYWERFFGRTMGKPANASYKAYLSSTGVIVFVCIIGFVLSLLPAPPQPTGFRPDVPHSRSNSPSGHFQVGDQVKIGSMWIITVNDAQVKPTTGLLPAKAGNTFLALDVTLKNISPQTNTLATSLQFVLQDSHNVSYEEEFIVATPPPAAAQNGNVPAGVTVHGQLNYQVPVSISQFTLSFKADWKNYDPTTSKSTVWDITTNSVASSGTNVVPTPSVNGSTPGYTGLQQAYQGSVVNTTDNSNVSASASISSVIQDQQGNISGNMTIQLPLTGSGLFKGTVRSDGSIQFTVMSNDGSGYTSIQFTGTIHQDGSMSGTYTLPGTTQGGTWQFKPV